MPGAIGAYEGGIAAAFELVGRSRADGVAYAMTIHATELVVVAAGILSLAQLGVGLVSVRRAGAARPARARTRRAPGRA